MLAFELNCSNLIVIYPCNFYMQSCNLIHLEVKHQKNHLQPKTLEENFLEECKFYLLVIPG